MMKIPFARTAAAAAIAASVLALPLIAQERKAQEKPRTAGPTDAGFLLPNGWTLTPAGEQVPLNDLVLNIIPGPDGRRALVSSNGYNTHELSLVDLGRKEVVAKQSVRQSWFGLALEPEAGKVWWGSANMRSRLRLSNPALRRMS